MIIKSRRFILAAGVLGAALAVTSPALAQHGGGGHGGGGGGHVGGGGGGHAAAGHVGGAGGHFGGGAHYGGVAGAHYTSGVGRGYGGGVVRGGYGAGFHGSGYGGRAAYGHPGGGFDHHGYSTGAYWRGGYWRGGFWPRAYYGYGFSWFLPVLPLAYATYWYGGIPYYYANDVYYTWNPDYDGYTATDPPPVADSSPGSDGAAAPPPQAAPGAGDTGPGAGAQIFMYPKNGQSEEQQSTDKRECQQWAATQAGSGAANGSDYRRAMMACVEGRGYSAN
jgi:hypothetical protein